jgi:hypothetical protein
MTTARITYRNANANISTVHFINLHSGTACELTRFRGGRTELYQEYQDQPGLMQFVGYLADVEHHLPAGDARAIAAANWALCEAHDAYLAGSISGRMEQLRFAAVAS